MANHSRHGVFYRTSTFRLLLLYISLFGLSMMAVLLFVYWTTAQNLVRLNDDAIEVEMSELADQFKDGGVNQLKELLLDRMSVNRVNNAVYLLTDQAFRPLVGNVPAWPLAATLDDRWLSFTLPKKNARGEMGQQAARALALSLPDGSVLMVGRDLRDQEHFKLTIWHAVVWAGLLTIALGIGGGYVMSRMMLRRLDLMTRGAERIMRGGVGLRMPVLGSDDEFDRLAHTLNAMLAEIERLIQTIRNVTTNLAHDLRSPLTRIKSKLELSLQAGRNQKDAIGFAIHECDQLLKTFSALLSIAEAEAGTAKASMGPVDLSFLAQDVVELYEPIAEDKGLNLWLEATPGLTVTGHRQLLFQALLNLVDNAIKYTDVGEVMVTVAQEEGATILRVTDTGPGIEEADRSRVLQQFVRLDTARTSQGNGLGLSLVSAIIKLHGADMQLNHHQPQGLAITLRFNEQ